MAGSEAAAGVAPVPALCGTSQRWLQLLTTASTDLPSMVAVTMQRAGW
jgi:hypothetical protein